MTSLGCEEMWNCLTFKITGKINHRIGTLVPASQESTRYLQLYFLGNAEKEVKIRQSNNHVVLDLEIMQCLQQIMHNTNCMYNCSNVYNHT